MPFTTGNDTVTLPFDDADIDGLAGDDLLILTEATDYLGLPIAGFSFFRFGDQFVRQVAFLNPPGSQQLYVWSWNYVRNVEHIDLTAPLNLGGRLETGAGNDTIRGSNNRDDITPGDGTNIVYAGGGDDIIFLRDGGGADWLICGTGNDIVVGAGLNDTINGGQGYDILNLSLREESLPVSLDLQAVYGNPDQSRFERVNLFLSPGDDVIRATELRGDLIGNDGDDVLIFSRAGLSAVVLNPPDNDFFFSMDRIRFIGSAFDDRVTGGELTDTLGGGAGDDTLFGAFHRDAKSAADVFFGGAGDDVLVMVGIDDTVAGGAGYDVAVVDFSGAAAGVTLGRGQSPTTFSGIECYLGTMTRHDDTVYASFLPTVRPHGPDGDFAGLYGGLGHDTLVLDFSTLRNGWLGVSMSLDERGAGRVSEFAVDASRSAGTGIGDWEEIDVTGSRHDDTLMAGGADDVLRGEGGNDTLFSGTGTNELFGGNGDDFLVASPDGSTRAYGGAGQDRIELSRLGQTVDGGRGEDTVELDFSHVSITGGVTLSPQGFDSGRWSRVENVTGILTRHDDTARLGFLGTGDGVLSGGAGRDTVILDYSAAGKALSASVSGGQFTVRMADGTTVTGQVNDFETLNFTGTAGNDFAGANLMQARLFGLSGSDTLVGSDGDDLIDGGKDNDSLVGNFGNDLIIGGFGDDTIIGGSQIHLAYGGDHDTLKGGAGDDIIIGLNGHDLIQAGDGEDGIAGSAGNDQIFGGLGADLFYYEGNIDSGGDRISDYSEASDLIWISGGLTSRNVTMRDVGADKLVNWANGSILLDNMAGQTVTLYFDADFA